MKICRPFGLRVEFIERTGSDSTLSDEGLHALYEQLEQIDAY